MRRAREPGVYGDPIMKTFIGVATETVFGALWTRPGHGPRGANYSTDRSTCAAPPCTFMATLRPGL